MQYEPAVTIIIHQPKKWKAIAKYLCEQSGYVVRQKDKFHRNASFTFYQKIKEK